MPAGSKKLLLLLLLLLVTSLSGCLSTGSDPEVARTVTPETEAVVLGSQSEAATLVKPPVPAKPGFAELYVNPLPANARIRVLNIKPKFVQGMRLTAGAYHLEVTAPGYQKYLQWITLDPGKMRRLKIELAPQ